MTKQERTSKHDSHFVVPSCYSFDDSSINTLPDLIVLVLCSLAHAFSDTNDIGQIIRRNLQLLVRTTCFIISCLSSFAFSYNIS